MGLVVVDRVAFDVAALRAAPTGVGVYIRELGRALRTLKPEMVRYIGVRAGGGFDIGTDTSDPRPPRGPGRHGGYLPWLERRAEWEAREIDADLVHYTAALAPITARLPYVVTVFDLSVLRDPRHHPPLRVARIPWLALAAHRARCVIVPSEATRRDVSRGLGVPARRIVVVPLAPAHVGDPGPRDGDRTVLAGLGVAPGDYVLATGGLDGRKNPLALVRALYRSSAPTGSLRLVICGPRGHRADRIEASIRAADIDGRVTITGYVGDDQLGVLLRNAVVFAFVSLHEGFGLPILEAMRVGVPVVTSRVSAMPEVAGGAAVLVDPRDAEDIGRGLTEAIERNDELRAAGLARALTRTWHDVARDTLEVYDRALR